MIYEGDVYFPGITDSGVPYNGGIPQVGMENIEFHLATLRENLPYRMPRTSEPIVTIFDFESWDPSWGAAGYYYKEASRARVRAQHPDWTDAAQIEAEASRQFREAALSFYLAMVHEVKRLYPNTLIGFYGRPAAYLYEYGYQGVHGARYRSWNDDLAPLYREIDVLSPVIYLFFPVGYVWGGGYVQTYQDNTFFIGDAIQEADRIRLTYPNAQLIIPIAWHRFHDHSAPDVAGQYLDQIDLQSQLFFARSAGANGIYLWGNENTDAEADYGNFFRDRLDPLVRAQCGTN